MLKRTPRSGRGHLSTYRTYVFVNKDIVIDRIRTLVQDENIDNAKLSIISGVSASTLYNWFDGPTRRPQYATVMAVVTSLGYESKFVKIKKIDIAKEVEKATAELKAATKRKKGSNKHQ